MKPPCPQCDRIHAADDVRAIGLFSASGTRYQTPDGRRYSSRVAAERALCRARAAAPTEADWQTEIRRSRAQ